MLVCSVIDFFLIFFTQKTAYEMRISDWSSDVCSSDLKAHETFCPSGHLGYGVGTKSLDDGIEGGRDRRHSAKQLESVLANSQRLLTMHRRSEERRVGKEGVSTGRSRWAPYQ